MRTDINWKCHELVEIFDQILGREDFLTGLRKSKTGEWLVWTWKKVVDEAVVHQIDLLVSGSSEARALANQRVFFRTEEKDFFIDGQTLERVYSNGRIDLSNGILGPLPWALSKIRVNRGLQKSLAWFEQFSSIPECIERVESGLSNIGSGAAASRVLQLLRSHMLGRNG